jgi:hypothetical protein
VHGWIQGLTSVTNEAAHTTPHCNAVRLRSLLGCNMMHSRTLFLSAASSLSATLSTSPKASKDGTRTGDTVTPTLVDARDGSSNSASAPAFWVVLQSRGRLI